MRQFFLLIVFLTTMSTSFADEPRCQPIAHRGLLLHAPENTITNFAVCRMLRIGFEFDVRRSQDGTLICLHDDTLERTTNGKGKASDQSITELFKLDAGAWFDPAFRGERIPTIDQVFKLVATAPNPNAINTADLKADDERLEADIVALAKERSALQQLLFIGRAIDHAEVRARLRQADPKCHVACLAQTSGDLAKAIEDRDSDWVYVRFVPSVDDVKRIRAAGKCTIIAGVKVSGLKKENWSSCSQAGVDAILTDYPLECRLLLRERLRPGSPSR